MTHKENHSLLHIVGTIPHSLHTQLPSTIANYTVYQSDGLKKHIEKRHPDCLSYLNNISDIIKSPDYIGISPNETVPSFELVKKLNNNVLIGIKLDKKDNYLYIATLHTITTSKLERRIESGRLKAVDKLRCIDLY